MSLRTLGGALSVDTSQMSWREIQEEEKISTRRCRVAKIWIAWILFEFEALQQSGQIDKIHSLYNWGPLGSWIYKNSRPLLHSINDIVHAHHWDIFLGTKLSMDIEQSKSWSQHRLAKMANPLDSIQQSVTSGSTSLSRRPSGEFIYEYKCMNIYIYLNIYSYILYIYIYIYIYIYT